ncbi:MAG: hypothetical protein ACRCXC_04820 [Legionella sp.]
MISLGKRCLSDALIEKLLKRPETTQKVLDTVLDNENLSVDRLTQILKHEVVTDEIRGRVFTHKNADKSVRDVLNAHLHPEYLLALLASNKPIDKSEWLMILQHPTAITKNVLLALVNKTALYEEVRCSVAEHDSTDHEVLTKVIYRQDFSHAVAQKIIELAKVDAVLLVYIAQQILARHLLHHQDKNLLW